MRGTVWSFNILAPSFLDLFWPREILLLISESWAKKKSWPFFPSAFSMGVGCFYKELSIGFTAFGAAITACEELGLWRQSLVLLADAITVAAVNAVVLNAAISACGKGAGANETVRECYFSVGYTH